VRLRTVVAYRLGRLYGTSETPPEIEVTETLEDLVSRCLPQSPSFGAQHGPVETTQALYDTLRRPRGRRVVSEAEMCIRGWAGVPGYSDCASSRHSQRTRPEALGLIRAAGASQHFSDFLGRTAARLYSTPGPLYGTAEWLYSAPARLYRTRSPVSCTAARLYGAPGWLYSAVDPLYGTAGWLYSAPDPLCRTTGPLYRTRARLYKEIAWSMTTG
jgi:hypothetical protein